MSHTSPASNLVWAIISSLIQVFEVRRMFMLWKDLWPTSGEIQMEQRTFIWSVQTDYDVPLIMSYAIGFTIIKYYEGFVGLPVYGIIPKPYELWEPWGQKAYLPLLLCLSIGWSLEITPTQGNSFGRYGRQYLKFLMRDLTYVIPPLVELCFWLFLVNSGSRQQDWFHSLYFKTWVVGSVLAVIYMPTVTTVTRSDPLKAEAYTFLAGSLGSLSLTLWFIPILFTFPSFLRNLRKEGVDTNTIVRLTKFSELNTIRVVFRFLFTIPLLTLGADDFLAMLAGFGCSISSGITLVIFFPRSIEGEIAARDASKERKRTRTGGADTPSVYESRGQFTRTNMTQQSAQTVNYGTSGTGTYLLTSSPIKSTPLQLDGESIDDRYNYTPPARSRSTDKYPGWGDLEERDVVSTLPPLRPNRRKGTDVELGGIDYMTEENVSKLNPKPSTNVNHMVHNFTSPIDIAYSTGQNAPGSGGMWLTFSRQK
ncbi:hypothetical protein H0H92_012494 [Tricholoma furcatifolium]|nr:hypothetical protein H0H92_012494 [Tricholoma furcatifolium]